MADSRKKLPHLLLPNIGRLERFSSPSGGRTRAQLPHRDPRKHAPQLLEALSKAREQAEAGKAEALEKISAVGVRQKQGVHLEFASEPGFGLQLAGMELRRDGVQLANVRTQEHETGEVTLATVYIPSGKVKAFETKLRQYETEVTAITRKPKHQSWAAPIAAIRRAILRAFWTDAPDAFPSQDQLIWWEVWAVAPPAPSRQAAITDVLESLGLKISRQVLEFPERLVVLAYGSASQLEASVEVLDSIAELRRAREVPLAYRELPPREMSDWSEDLVDRVQAPRDDTALCILDTGVNRGHPLLGPFLEPRDTHAVRRDWGEDDHQGHGTEMAGIGIYGDLAEALSSSGPIESPAVLESVKILPPTGENDPELWGAITQQAVALVEIERPQRRRSHLMAIAALETENRGRPTSWSGAVDQLASSLDDEKGRQRLLILAAGNNDRGASGEVAWRDHPDHLATSPIHDPGQAWNAVTVGACTDRWQIEEEDLSDWTPISEPGDLAPMTSTSLTWQHSWPIKPDIVMEGGNAAIDATGQIDKPDSLGLLTTYYRYTERSFTITGDTSAASAQAARIASFIQARYPDYWPETVRGLLVHSARWSQAMLKRFGPFRGKVPVRELMRSCGYGTPTLDRTLWSASHRLTMIVQSELQPYTKMKNGKRLSAPQINEMQYHALPWPREELESLGEMDIQLRVTLSYFIEPSPGERGWDSRYRYASHGLRFDIKGAQETESNFEKRLNQVAREEEEEKPEGADQTGWFLGPKLRNRGSILSDIWTGTAADLATRKHIAVFPVGGWWNERHHLGRWNRKARYSLIVSIEAPEIEVDLYTPVAAQIGIPIEITT